MECPLIDEDAANYIRTNRLNPCSNGMPSDTMIQRALTFLLF